MEKFYVNHYVGNYVMVCNSKEKLENFLEYLYDNGKTKTAQYKALENSDYINNIGILFNIGSYVELSHPILQDYIMLNWSNYEQYKKEPVVFNFEDYSINYAMCIETIEQYISFATFLNSKGKTWNSGSSYLKDILWEKEPLLMYFNRGTYGALGCAKENIKVLYYKDFIFEKDKPVFDIDNFKGDYCMACRTEEEAKKFCNYLFGKHKHWKDGDEYLTTMWGLLEERTAYLFNAGSFESIAHCKKDGLTVLESTDFEIEIEGSFTTAEVLRLLKKD